MLPPENEDDALRLIYNMEAYYAQAMLSFEEDENYYEGLLDGIMKVPEGFQVTIPTTARAVIDEAVDNVEPYDMIVHYAPRSFSKQAQEDADNIGRFLKNIWLYWRQRGADIDVVRDFIKNLFKHGKACFKVVPEWSLWPELSEKEEAALLNEGGKKSVAERAKLIKQLRKENFPIICRSLSPRHIMEDPSMDSRKLFIIEQYSTSIEEIRNKWGEFEPYLKMHEPFGFNMRELWTATYLDENGGYHKGRHFMFINDILVHEEDNIYHELPYIVKYSGFGTESYDGTPERKATGFFNRQVKSMLKAEIRRVTHFDAMMQQLAFPILIVPDVLEDIGFDTAPGAVNYVPDDFLNNAEKMFLQAKLPAPEYMQSLNMIQSQIERGTTQRAIRGAGVPGTDSAAQLSMITSQAKLRLEPIKKTTEDAVDAVNSIILRYVANIFEDAVSVFGCEALGPDQYIVRPSMIGQRYRTRTSFLPNEEQVKERKLVLITDAMTKAGLNPYDAYTYANWENPMEVIARNLAYEIMQEPSIKRQLAKKALEDWGLDAKELELEELMDQNIIQQMMAEMQSRMQGQGQGAPGDPLMGGNSGGGMPAQDPMMQSAPPQAAGSPLDMPQQLPEVNQMTRDIGMLQ